MVGVFLVCGGGGGGSIERVQCSVVEANGRMCIRTTYLYHTGHDNDKFIQKITSCKICIFKIFLN